MVGRHGYFYRLWGGPRLVFIATRAELVLHAPGPAGAPAQEDVAPVAGTGAFWGLQVGAAVGYSCSSSPSS